MFYYNTFRRIFRTTLSAAIECLVDIQKYIFDPGTSAKFVCDMCTHFVSSCVTSITAHIQHKLAKHKNSAQWNYISPIGLTSRTSYIVRIHQARHSIQKWSFFQNNGVLYSNNFNANIMIAQFTSIFSQRVHH